MRYLHPVAALRQAVLRRTIEGYSIAEIQHRHDDQDGDELQQDAQAHQAVGMRTRELAAAEEAVEPDAEDQEHGPGRDADKYVSAHRAGLAPRLRQS